MGGFCGCLAGRREIFRDDCVTLCEANRIPRVYSPLHESRKLHGGFQSDIFSPTSKSAGNREERPVSMIKKGTKLLIVDDEPGVRLALSEALRSWGYESIQAGTVSEAIKLFDQDHPTVALLDIDLPDGSGLDILSEIKERQPDTVAIMITGNVNVPNVLTALRGGAYDFISKPIHLEELRVTL